VFFVIFVFFVLRGNAAEGGQLIANLLLGV
jgi:hypothetical protein